MTYALLVRFKFTDQNISTTVVQIAISREMTRLIIAWLAHTH